jgi:hypothetical protein
MQNGSLIETKRRNGRSVWEFRWRDRTSGKAVYRRIVVGTIEQFKTEADAREIIEGIVLEINSDEPPFPFGRTNQRKPNLLSSQIYERALGKAQVFSPG